MTKYWYISDRKVNIILGEFNDYLAYKKAIVTTPVKEVTVKEKRTQTRVSYKDKRRFEELGREIEALEQQLEDTDDQIAQETTNYERLNQLTALRDDLEYTL